MLKAVMWFFTIVLGAIFVAGLIFMLIGMVYTSFHTEPITDKVEEALEEVTRRNRK